MTQKMNGIAFFDEGPRGGTPLLMIHGFPFSHAMWDPQIKIFSKNFRVISYDVRGHGESEPGDGRYTFESFVDDLLMLMDHLKVPSAVVCGLSMGGYIALRAVERHPQRFSGLILCDTKSAADSSEARIKRAATADAVKKEGVGPFADRFIKTVLTEKTLRTNAVLVETVRGLILKNPPLGICGTLLALAGRTDTTAALPKMALPALVLVGEEDLLTPPSDAQAMAKLLPDARLCRIPGAAHLSNLENPAAFNEPVTEFLKRF